MAKFDSHTLGFRTNNSLSQSFVLLLSCSLSLALASYALSHSLSVFGLWVWWGGEEIVVCNNQEMDVGFTSLSSCLHSVRSFNFVLSLSLLTHVSALFCLYFAHAHSLSHHFGSSHARAKYGKWENSTAAQHIHKIVVLFSVFFFLVCFIYYLVRKYAHTRETKIWVTNTHKSLRYFWSCNRVVFFFGFSFSFARWTSILSQRSLSLALSLSLSIRSISSAQLKISIFHLQIGICSSSWMFQFVLSYL